MNTFEESFFRRLQQGDVGAFSELFAQYHRLLYALAYRYLKSQEEAEDAVQYTFMRIWERRETLVWSESIRSLLFTVIKNYVLNELKHRQIVCQKYQEIAGYEENMAECFTIGLEHQDLKRELHEAIARLPLQKREVFRLKIDRGLSNQQIAEKMNLSVSTVKSHYTQAIKMLRKTLGRINVFFLFLP
ncbi:RNA polymerase sigma-70 factor [Bacteroides sp.]|uniref:RNA polymerase sigma-70 factor n=1 Tax=Bacteroides sp. TaxID=29523 RepID=UPI002FC92BF4